MKTNVLFSKVMCFSNAVVGLVVLGGIVFACVKGCLVYSEYKRGKEVHQKVMLFVCDPERAVEWYHKEAIAYPELESNRLVQRMMGVAYADGLGGLEQNDVQAVKFLHRSSELGDPDAKAYLAKMYLQGRGVERDESKALDMLNEVCEESLVARYMLAMLYRSGIAVVADYGKASRMFLEIAQAQLKGYHDVGRDRNVIGLAARAYAEMVENGLGVERNVERALDWYRTALSSGCSGAQEDIERLEKMNP